MSKRMIERAIEHVLVPVPTGRATTSTLDRARRGPPARRISARSRRTAGENPSACHQRVGPLPIGSRRPVRSRGITCPKPSSSPPPARPIGRANKGSLVDVRPDDLGGHHRQRRCSTKVPAARPQPGRGPDPGLRPARRRGGLQHRPASPRILAGMPDVPGVTVNRYCSSSLQTIRMAAHAIKAGEGDVFVAAGVETVSRFMQRRGRHRPAQRRVRRRRGPHRRAHRRRPGRRGPRRRACPTSTSPWARPPRTSPSTRTCPARRWTSSPRRRSSGPSQSQENGFFEREITPVTTPDGTVVSQGRRHPRRHDGRGPRRR